MARVWRCDAAGAFGVLTCLLCVPCRSCRLAPLIQCDYCPLLFHMDCLDPPLTALPAGKWMCPNHVEHLVVSGPGGGGAAVRGRWHQELDRLISFLCS